MTRAGLVRFIPRQQGAGALIGEPVDRELDVGKAVRNGEAVQVRVFSGSSVLNPGSPTSAIETISRILSPLSAAEVGTIRCIGLNVSCLPQSLAAEVDWTLGGKEKAQQLIPTV